MKKGAAALRDAEVPFMLGGGLAAWAYGGPPTDHDVDFLLREADAERALEALVEVGHAARAPAGGLAPEGVGRRHPRRPDLRASGRPRSATSTSTARSTSRSTALPLLVASIDDVLATKVLAISEQDPDYRPVLEIARSLREQIDWELVRAQVEGTPFGAAFFTLVERLRILPEPVGARDA